MQVYKFEVYLIDPSNGKSIFVGTVYQAGNNLTSAAAIAGANDQGTLVPPGTLPEQIYVKAV